VCLTLWRTSFVVSSGSCFQLATLVKCSAFLIFWVSLDRLYFLCLSGFTTASSSPQILVAISLFQEECQSLSLLVDLFQGPLYFFNCPAPMSPSWSLLMMRRFPCAEPFLLPGPRGIHSTNGFCYLSINPRAVHLLFIPNAVYSLLHGILVHNSFVAFGNVSTALFLWFCCPPLLGSNPELSNCFHASACQ